MLSPPSSKRRTEGSAAAAADRTAMKPLVLIVEDEQALVTLLRYNFEAAGYEVATALDRDEALMAIAERRPDLIVLDWMLPSISGLEVCRQIRRKAETRDVPVIMLTARGEEADRVRGLDSGADDYVTKPFSPTELVARVRAVLRRSRPSTAEEMLAYAGIVMDLAAHRVMRNARAIHLGPTEFRLLEFLMKTPGRVFSREQLLDGVWGHDVYVDERTVDVPIGRLRRALNRGRGRDPIRTVRGAGYALNEQFERA